VEYGTGRHWWVLEDEDRKVAMRVCNAQAAFYALLTDLVLVVLLPLVLSLDDLLENIHRLVPAPHHHSTTRHLDHLWSYGYHCPHRAGVFLRHTIPVQPYIVLLGQRRERIMRQHGRHHCTHVSVQCLQCHLRLYLCSSSGVPHMGTKHGQEDQSGLDPNRSHGLRVGLTTPDIEAC
jgi:hypothetical protein